MPDADKKMVKCVVACRQADGLPTFFPCVVKVSRGGYDEGAHYALARDEAADARYDSTDRAIVYDENDGPKFLFARLFKNGKPTFKDL